MAKALECPACGARHGLDTLPDARTFRCDRCGQVLKVPEGIDAQRAPRGARGSAAPSPAAPAAAGAGGTLAPPPRRGGSAATGQRVSATATATMPAVAPTAAAAGTADTSRERAARQGAAPARTKRVHWYWRILAWVVAIPLGLLVTGWPAFQFDLLNKDDLLDVFVGEGSGRYVRLLLFAAAWALVTALLVQLFVEGGRWFAARRARTEAAPA